MTKLSPIVSEFETSEQAEAYDRWLHAKVSASLSDKSEPVPHDEAMTRVRALIDKKGNDARRLAR